MRLFVIACLSEPLAHTLTCFCGNCALTFMNCCCCCFFSRNSKCCFLVFWPCVWVQPSQPPLWMHSWMSTGNCGRAGTTKNTTRWSIFIYLYYQYTVLLCQFQQKKSKLVVVLCRKRRAGGGWFGRRTWRRLSCTTWSTPWANTHTAWAWTTLETW